MSRAAVEQLVDRWMSDTEFRAAVRENPEATVKATGADLTEEEMAALRAIDWNLSDEELQSRANLDGCCCEG